MIKLQKKDYPAISELYGSEGAGSFFPLIGAVLSDTQNGEVYADNAVEPSQFYVEHRFGFAQIFGKRCQTFEAALERHFLEKNFTASKVRLYTPQLPDFLRSPAWGHARSFRQRFTIDPEGLSKAQAANSKQSRGMTTTNVDAQNVAEMDHSFGVVERFWRGRKDFIHQSNAIVALYEGKPAAICYAAALADRRAEIDVLTLPEFRQLGAGKLAVMHFVGRCIEQSLHPLWDCFSNNAGSVQLCQSVGFSARGEPYPFFTVNK